MTSTHLAVRLERRFRWLYSALIALTVVGLSGLWAPAARADTWDFSLTNPGNTVNIDFSFSTTAASTAYIWDEGPSYPYNGPYFQMDSPVDWTVNGVDQGVATMSFWSLQTGGGLYLYSGDDILNLGDDILNMAGPQLYTGPESAPTFVAGTYQLDSFGKLFDEPLTLTLTDPVPEPSSVLLVGAGLLSLLGLAGYQLRRRRLQVEA